MLLKYSFALLTTTTQVADLLNIRVSRIHEARGVAELICSVHKW